MVPPPGLRPPVFMGQLPATAGWVPDQHSKAAHSVAQLAMERYQEGFRMPG
jgi:hypothetical protein